MVLRAIFGVAGNAVKAIINKSRQKKAQKKLAKAQAKEQAALSSLAQKISLPAANQNTGFIPQVVSEVSGGAVIDRLAGAQTVSLKQYKQGVNPLVWVAAAAVAVLLLLFKRK